ncbi:glutathione peroxidase [Pseudokordiimonas caeni]|uniref:glutathione peroxidase n=1 Tax=Pseudokordiimonas caeni TaxID=2997908 RepID=UPI0028115AB0|nr:redoxin domain-containing protein [Pseudokordiimonas caeni]
MSAYQFSLAPLTGAAPIRLADYRGRPVLVINTASKCRFTNQYEGLQALYEKYRKVGLALIGVPSDDFAKQEFALADQIAQFCMVNYGVSFPMAAKAHVVGDAAIPLFKWLADEGGVNAPPRWNFHKYLIGTDGKLAGFWPSIVGPDNKLITDRIEEELAKVTAPV